MMNKQQPEPVPGALVLPGAGAGKMRKSGNSNQKRQR